ncbi:MAG: large subunit ribosomal protein L23 [Saprospiraceae bacterium]|jgi:large subunit ribosomal protein L23
MAKTILVKPIITEKAEQLSENLNQYSFVVDRQSSKIQIKNAVQQMYDVKVASVNTAVMPGKTKSRNTRAGAIRGRVSSYKKAMVTLAEGQEIDFFGDI